MPPNHLVTLTPGLLDLARMLGDERATCTDRVLLLQSASTTEYHLKSLLRAPEAHNMELELALKSLVLNMINVGLRLTLDGSAQYGHSVRSLVRDKALNSPEINERLNVLELVLSTDPVCKVDQLIPEFGDNEVAFVEEMFRLSRHKCRSLQPATPAATGSLLTWVPSLKEPLSPRQLTRSPAGCRSTPERQTARVPSYNSYDLVDKLVWGGTIRYSLGVHKRMIH